MDDDLLTNYNTNTLASVILTCKKERERGRVRVKERGSGCEKLNS